MAQIHEGRIMESRSEQNIKMLKDEALATRGKTANLICNGWLMELTCNANCLYRLDVRWYRSKTHVYPHTVDAGDILNLNAMIAIIGAPHRNHLLIQDDQGSWEWSEPHEPKVEATAPNDDSHHQFVCGEVEAQLDAMQEIAATLNGIRPEITVRLRPVGTLWIGCQCGTKFVSASGETLGKATRNFKEALEAARK